MKKIGLFGGTFDPVHNGHMAVARAVLDQLELDILYFIPAATPPHKADQFITSFDHRLAMLRLALQDEPRFVVSDIEGLRSGPSYTIDTLSQFCRKLGAGVDLFFIIGLDAFAEITTWKGYRELLERSSFVVIDRPSHGNHDLKEVVAGSFPDYQEDGPGIWWKEGGKRIISLSMEPVAVSSSMVRDVLRKGLAVENFIPPAVVSYLLSEHLYGKAVR
ncbi:MAG: nicotinate-nucleotide adenylyltransferase [Pseudomonadota bacterium]